MLVDFKWRIFPDTIYFWMDLLMSSWDKWQKLKFVPEDRILFKQHDDVEEKLHLDSYARQFSGFSLSKPNRFRCVV